MDKKDFGTSILAVELATHNAAGPRRTATTMINPASAASPSGGSPVATEDLADAATAAAAAATSDDRAHNYKARSIALLDLPDTVNDARVRALAEQVGPLAKVSLRPDKGGAIVEFRDVADVGRAELMLQGMEIDPGGRRVRVGGVVELLKDGRAERKEQQTYSSSSTTGKASAGGSGGAKARDAALSMRPAPRTGQQGPRRGGRGGLGFRKVLDAAVVAARSEVNGDAGERETSMVAAEESGAEHKGGAKSNADFRAMLGA